MHFKNKRNGFVSCIVPAGGSGERMGTKTNKLFLEIAGVPVIAHTLLALQRSDVIDEIIVSAKEDLILAIKDVADAFSITKLKTVVKGGATRAESVKAALCELDERTEYVSVHDGARPFVSVKVIKEVVSSAKMYGAAACGVRPKNTLKRENAEGFISETVDRSVLYEIQTPQVFSKELFFKAYDADASVLKDATDDCMLAEGVGAKVKITEGSYRNIKITTIEDIKIAEALLDGEE